MAFDLSTRLLLALGHSIRDMDGTGTYIINLPPLTPDSVAYIEDLLSQSDTLMAAYDAALTDSMAVQVDNLKLDYGRHLSYIAQRGTNVLKQLSGFANIPMMSNRFTGQDFSPQSVSTGNPPVSVRAYY